MPSFVPAILVSCAFILFSSLFVHTLFWAQKPSLRSPVSHGTNIPAELRPPPRQRLTLGRCIVGLLREVRRRRRRHLRRGRRRRGRRRGGRRRPVRLHCCHHQRLPFHPPDHDNDGEDDEDGPNDAAYNRPNGRSLTTAACLRDGHRSDGDTGRSEDGRERGLRLGGCKVALDVGDGDGCRVFSHGHLHCDRHFGARLQPSPKRCGQGTYNDFDVIVFRRKPHGGEGTGEACPDEVLFALSIVCHRTFAGHADLDHIVRQTWWGRGW